MSRNKCITKAFFVSFTFLLVQVLFYIYLAVLGTSKPRVETPRIQGKQIINPHFLRIDFEEEFLEELDSIDRVMRGLGCSPFILTSKVLEQLWNIEGNKTGECEPEICTLNGEDIVLGVENECITKMESRFDNLFKNFRKEGFLISYIESHKTTGLPPKSKVIPTAIVVEKIHFYPIVILHSREDNFWWHGSIHDDPKAKKLLAAAHLHPTTLFFMHNEGAIPKVELREARLLHYHFLVPKNIPSFIKATSEGASKFIECDYKLADKFFRAHGRDQSIKAVRFKHQAWKLLYRAKRILGELEVPFWLSSGTCLGYLRQCDFIPYSQDVDLGVFAADHKEEIIPAFLSHGFKLHHTFGRQNDSYQIAFEYNQIKLDIFFFYHDKDKGVMWNGGTEARSGQKFKYIFKHFSLCWTEFLELLVKVPCDTDSYIEANYGKEWFTPVSEWSWKSSPPNVQTNGVWPKEEWNQVINIIPT